MSDKNRKAVLNSEMNKLKKHVFYEMLNLAGRVFVLVRHSDDVIIGKRGFLPEEKEKGLILVLNTRMNFIWDDKGISVKLVFGTVTEPCFIPAGQIVSVFSPELNAQFSVTQEDGGKAAAVDTGKPKKPAKKKTPPVDNIISVDFKRKK